MTMMNNSAVRPVTIRDIAAALHMNPRTVSVYLYDRNRTSANALRVREYAESVGFDGKKAREFTFAHMTEARQHAKEMEVRYYYHNGNFGTKEAEVQRMKELRDMGYSNREIAQKIGRTWCMVYQYIGKQDPELSRQNRSMAAHIRAQKNAARRQYVLNKPIREYNEKVAKHNKMKAELNLLQTELLVCKPEIMKAAQTEIKFPLVDLKTVQPTALQ